MKTKNSHCKNKKSRIVLLSIIVAFLLCIVGFLASIRFQLFNYIVHAEPHYRSSNFYKEFKEQEENFNLLASEINTVVNQTPDLFDKYSRHFGVDKNGFVFYTNSFPCEIQYVASDCNGWEEIVKCMRVFPYNSTIRINEKYPNYVLFDSETERSLYVWTRGERPNNLINEMWKEYKYVRVRKMSKGWYDIYPVGVKLTDSK